MGQTQFEIVDILFDGSERLITNDFWSFFDVTKALAMAKSLPDDVELRRARQKDVPANWVCEVARKNLNQ
jgi:hypothetical protein